MEELLAYLAFIKEWECVEKFYECVIDDQNEIVSLVLKADLSITEDILEAFEDVISNRSLMSCVISGQAAELEDLQKELQYVGRKTVAYFIDELMTDLYILHDAA